MDPADLHERLATWLAAQLPGVGEVHIEGVDRIQAGHSAETLQLTIRWRDGDADRREAFVIRMRPPAPGLLEPYDFQRQFAILRALEDTPVRAPRALWLEGSGTVLGHEFYLMERLDGDVYERFVPNELAHQPQRIHRMSEAMVEQIAAIHSVDLCASGLDALGDGRDYLDRELDRWEGEMDRVRRSRLPALERLVTVLRERQPEPCPKVGLVHGDPKPGNFAFIRDEVSAVFDWELSTVGDPLADVGWVELSWRMPGAFTRLEGSLSVDDFVARYQEITGTIAKHRAWYRALQGLKMAVIMLVGGTLFESGVTDDLRLADMTGAIHPLTQRALRELGIDDALEPGCVTPRLQRVEEVRRRAAEEG